MYVTVHDSICWYFIVSVVGTISMNASKKMTESITMRD